MSDVSEKLKPYEFHGLSFTQDKKTKNYVTDCFTCGKEKHFGILGTTGQYKCLRCGCAGNISTFLQQLHKLSMEQTSIEEYTELSENRNIPAAILREWGVCKNIINGEWILPAYNAKSVIANLAKIVVSRKGGKISYRPYWTPGQTLHPLGLQFLKKSTKTVWVAEGPWDGMKHYHALKSLRRKSNGEFIRTTDTENSLLKTQGVIIIPGANTFKPDWLSYINDVEANLVFDNDHPRSARPELPPTRPGIEGMERILKMAQQSNKGPNTLNIIKWGEKGHNEELPHGYDLRDVYTEKGLQKGYKFLLDNLSPQKMNKTEGEESHQEEIEALPRSSFQELCDDFNSELHFTSEMRDTLAVILGVILSTQLDGEQLWLRVIGPPGSGKTTLAECVSAAREYVYPQSKFTGFHSGFTGGNGNAKSRGDSSLIPTINGKTFVVKDGDTLITAPSRDTILAELRDLYDGVARAHYRNRKKANYEKIKVTMIVCATDAIRGLNRAFLGDRFLDCEILGKNGSQPFLDRAASNTFAKVINSLRPTDEQKEQDSKLLKSASVGYINYLKENIHTLTPPKLSASAEEKIKRYAQFLSFMRARVERDGDRMPYRPRVELATRLTSQLIKLAVVIALVTQKTTIDDEILRIVRKVVRDTSTGYPQEITEQLFNSEEEGMSYDQLAHNLSLPETNIKREIRDLLELGIVGRIEVPNHSGIRGRYRHLFSLTKTVRQLAKEIYNDKPQVLDTPRNDKVRKRPTLASRK